MSKSKAETALKSLEDGDGKYIVADGKVYNNMSESLRVLLYHPKFSTPANLDERAGYMAKLRDMGVDFKENKIYSYNDYDKPPNLEKGKLESMLRRYRDKDSFEVLGKAIEGIYRADVTGALNKELREMQGTPEGNQKAIALIDGLRDKSASNIADPAALQEKGAPAVSAKKRAPAVPAKKNPNAHAAARKAAEIADKGLQGTAKEKGADMLKTSTGNAPSSSLG